MTDHSGSPRPALAVNPMGKSTRNAPSKTRASRLTAFSIAAIRSSVSVYSDNVRLVANVESPVFGDVMNVYVLASAHALR